MDKENKKGKILSHVCSIRIGHVGSRCVSTEVASQRLNRQQGREFVNQPNAGGGGRILAVVVGAGQVGLSVF